jgi:hypothetical protein
MSAKEAIEREYRHKASGVKADSSLNWEKKMLALSCLRRLYDRKLREAEKGPA